MVGVSATDDQPKVETTNTPEDSQGNRTPTDILLKSNVNIIRDYMQSKPSGILICGADRETRRAIVRQISPVIRIVSCCDTSSMETMRDEEFTVNTVCIDDVDFPEARIEERVKGLFPIMLSRGITIIGLAAREAKVSTSIRRAGRFEVQHRVSPATLEQRSEAWESILSTLNFTPPSSLKEINECSRHLAALSPSYQLGDFTRVVHELLADQLSSHRNNDQTLVNDESENQIDFDSLVSTVKSHRPMQMETELSFLTASNSTAKRESEPNNHNDGHMLADHEGWGNHVGYDDVKETLIRLIDWPVLHKESFERLGINAPRGALIYGERGCGKSLLAQSLIRRMNYANWLWIAGQDIYCKYLGESEARIRMMFDHARTLIPCVVVIDDLDTIASKRDPDQDSSTGSSGVERRVLASLLTELDGFSSGDVFVVACAADVQSLDPAIVRPGRFDVMLELNLPSRRDRLCIVNYCLRHVAIAGGVQSRSNIIDMLVEQLEGRSGAEIDGVCREAVMLALEDAADNGNSGRTEVELRHFEQAVVEHIN